MLTEKQITRLNNPHHNTDSVVIYWNLLQNQESMTKQQLRTAKRLAEMPKKEQDCYVIIEDKLVKAPTKPKTYSRTSGVWKETNKYAPKNIKKG